MTWRHSARALWAELRERDTAAHREHLLGRAEDPYTSLIGHRVFALVVFAFGIVTGFGAGIGVAW
jgi:hypothetical protein